MLERDEGILKYMVEKRWYAHKSLVALGLKVLALFEVDERFVITMVQITFADQSRALYNMPIEITLERPAKYITSISTGGEEMFLSDAMLSWEFAFNLLRKMESGVTLYDGTSRLVFIRTKFFKGVEYKGFRPVEAEQSNSSSIVDDSIILKNYRFLQAGENPDVEIITGLEEDDSFTNIPRLLGYIKYVGDTEIYLSSAYEFIAGSSDCWSYYQGYLIQLLNEHRGDRETLARYLEKIAWDMGSLTGRMHLALSGIRGDQFRPELMDHEEISMVLERARRYLELSLESPSIKGSDVADQVRVLGDTRMHRVDERIGRISSQVIKIRVHGDYHLGQVLISNGNLYVIDFEGEPLKAMEARRAKQSPLKDIAGMIRSLDYLASSIHKRFPAELNEDSLNELGKDIMERFLVSYREAIDGRADIVPSEPGDLYFLLNLYLLEKASYELYYEINNRPSWIDMPLLSLIKILKSF